MDRPLLVGVQLPQALAQQQRRLTLHSHQMPPWANGRGVRRRDGERQGLARELRIACSLPFKATRCAMGKSKSSGGDGKEVSRVRSR